MNDNTLISVTKISKSFPGVQALNEVEFNLRKGEVHALLGENGAGKSTLIKIIAGIIQKDLGDIEVLGKKQTIKNPHYARELGIATVFQELSQVPLLSVAENVFLGQERNKSKVLLNRKFFIKETSVILDKFNISINLKSIVRDLSSAQKQLVEIIKAISQKPKVLILDEPTSSLTDNETKCLFEMINDLKKKGVGIIYISHRLDEILKVADKVTILRDGKVVCNDKTSNLDMKKIINFMVGRKVEIYKTTHTLSNKTKIKEKALQIKRLSKKGVFENISFDLYKGEILGIAGLIGSGRSELVKVIFGVNPYDSGKVIINGLEIKVKNVRQMIKMGLSLIPEDRHTEGLVLMHTVNRNIILPILKRFSNLGIMNYRIARHFVKEEIQKFNIVPSNMNMITENLSGGNQKKVCISKWLATNPEILIVDEPTVGIDVRTKSEIHRLLRNLVNNKISIIMVSSDMPELIEHSDRIMVMNKGKIIGFFNRSEMSQENIMSLIVNDNLKS